MRNGTRWNWMRSGVLMACGLLVALGGCKKEKAAETKPPAGNQTVTPPAQPRGVDELDSKAEQVQNRFPRSGQVGQWIKISPVTFYQGGELSQVGRVDLLRPYGVDWAADTQYRLGDKADETLVVQLFHCNEPAGAFGLMSVLSDQPATEQIGQMTRSEPGRAGLNIWAGSYLLRLYSIGQQGLTFQQAMRRMAADIVAQLPRGEGSLPALATVLPSAHQIPGQLHYFRGPASLQARGVTTVPYLEQALPAALNLGEEDEMVIAAYDAEVLRSPCLVFVARFKSAADASSAYGRLIQLRDSAESQLGLSLVVGDLSGRVVYGTLTGDQYGLLEHYVRQPNVNADEYPVFPTIQKNLSQLR